MMIKVRLQIGDGDIVDTIDGYGLVYLSSDNVFQAPLKAFATTNYAEENGEHSSNKTTLDAFDYKVEFLVRANGKVENANATIANFNSLLYTQEKNSDIKVFKEVSFYNDYKKVLIVGRPSLINEAREFWRDANGLCHDVVKVEWVIRVSNPSKCNFNLE